MPADVGSGSFWSEGTSLVNGDITAEEAAANIQATWPQGDQLTATRSAGSVTTPSGHRH